MSSPLGSPPATGKSFRFVRACDARFLDVKRNPGDRNMRPVLPVSLFGPGQFSLFPFLSTVFPFSLQEMRE